MEVKTNDVLKKIPSGLPYLFNKVAPAYIEFNMNWGFILDAAEYREHQDDFKSAAAAYIHERFPLAGGNSVCFTLDKNLIQHVATTLLPEIPAEAFESKAIQAAEEYSKEMDRVKKFFKRIITESTSKRNGAVVYNIALYSLNHGNKLVNNGIEYNAFKLTYRDFLSAMAAVGANIANFGIAVAGSNDKPVPMTPDSSTTKMMQPVVRTDAEKNDDYVAGVIFKLVFRG